MRINAACNHAWLSLLSGTVQAADRAADCGTCRQLVDDRSMRLRCSAVWELARTTQGRTSLPPVTVEAARASDVLVHQLQEDSTYEPLAALLKVFCQYVNLLSTLIVMPCHDRSVDLTAYACMHWVQALCSWLHSDMHKQPYVLDSLLVPASAWLLA